MREEENHMSGEFEELVNRENSGFQDVIKQVFDGLSEKSPESQALEQSLLKLVDYNAELAKLIGRNLNDANSLSDGNWPAIHTVLVPKNQARQLESRGFQPVPGAAAPRGIEHSLLNKNAANVARPLAFLHCPLAEIESYCHQVFKGSQNGVFFEYKLAPAYGLLAVEKVLRKFALLYRIEKPLIFSPWARRAAHIDFLNNFTPEEGVEIDLRPAANGLSGVLLRDWQLCWNVRLELLENKAGSNARPTPGHAFYTVLYNEGINGNVFVLPDDPGEQPPDLMIARRERDGIRIESPEKCGDKYHRLEILPVETPKELQDYSNECDAAVLSSSQRLRTAGEINRVLHALATSGYSGRYLRDCKEEHWLTPYNCKQKYPCNANEAIFANLKNRPEIRVAFSSQASNAKSDLFLDDYGNYVLAFLKERYPEYAWKGCKDTECGDKR